MVLLIEKEANHFLAVGGVYDDVTKERIPFLRFYTKCLNLFVNTK
jgi:hypothetical protein